MHMNVCKTEVGVGHTPLWGLRSIISNLWPIAEVAPRSVFKLCTLVCLSLAFACAESAQTQTTTQASYDHKVLIVYLSRTSNTKTVAEMIQRQVGGDLVPLELVTPYPENYQAIVQQVQQENERGYLPALKNLIPFNTNAGYGIGSSFEIVAKLCPDAKILEGFTVQGGIERDGVLLAITGERAEAVNQEVTAWLQKVYHP